MKDVSKVEKGGEPYTYIGFYIRMNYPKVVPSV